MNPELYHAAFRPTRRQFLGRATAAMGAFALASLLDPALARAASGLPGMVRANPRAKRVIYLFQSGGPPQHDTFDYKPHLNTVHGQETPASVFNGQRLTGMTSGQSSFPVARSIFDFKQHGQSGAWVSEVMPHAIKVDFWDTDALANAIVNILRHKALAESLKDNSSEEIESLTWKRAAVEIINLYREVYATN